MKPEDVRLVQSTFEQLVEAATQAVGREQPGAITEMGTQDGPTVGQQITIDATEPSGPLNLCRLSVLNPAMAPEAEAVRIEYERAKAEGAGAVTVYSIQSLRRRGGAYVLFENFLASDPESVRDQDFKAIESVEYAQTAYKSLESWLTFRAWQLQGGKR